MDKWLLHMAHIGSKVVQVLPETLGLAMGVPSSDGSSVPTHVPRTDRKLGPLATSLEAFFTAVGGHAYTGYVYSQSNIPRWTLRVPGAGEDTPTEAARASAAGAPPPKKAKQLPTQPEEARESPFKGLRELFADIFQQYWVRLPGTADADSPAASVTASLPLALTSGGSACRTRWPSGEGASRGSSSLMRR